MTTHSNTPEPSHYSASLPRTKRLGGYLVEAGLLTPAQVDVALSDQKNSGMRFGEALAARGWVRQQTIEYLMEKVILPEQEALKQHQPVDGALDEDVDTGNESISFNHGSGDHSARLGASSDESLRRDR